MATLRVLTLAMTAALLTAAKHPPAPPPPDPAPVAAPTIKAGVEKWHAGDYAAAVAIWQPFAAAGDPDALFNLGQAYKLGRGVAADPEAARDYYRKAAVKGHLPAQANLGIALFQAGEKPEAVKWLKTAADRGEARAQYVLGIASFNGDGVPRSQSLGYAYLLRAQASGLPQAGTALGSITPGLSPGDRSAGEAIAASLAAGTGVPAALATAGAARVVAGMPPSRATAGLPTGLPIVTPPTAAPLSSSAAGPVPAVRPPAPVAITLPAAPVRTAATGARPVTPAAAEPVAKPAGADRPVLPPVPRPAPAIPLREPTPAQADAAAAAPPRPAVAMVDVAASRPVEVAPSRPVEVAPSRTADPVPKISDPLAAAPPRVGARAAPPVKPFEVAAEAPVKKPDGWRVQLGAFSSRKLADAAWADAKATAAPARPVFATDGAVTKLQLGPFATRDAAKAACTKLTAAGRACFVTAG